MHKYNGKLQNRNTRPNLTGGIIPINGSERNTDNLNLT